MYIGDAQGASALAFAMGERGLFNDGEFFIIAVDVIEPFDIDKPEDKTTRKFLLIFQNQMLLEFTWVVHINVWLVYGFTAQQMSMFNK